VSEGENGRAKVESVAVLFEEVEFSANLFVLFKDLDLVAGGTKRDGGGETTEAGSDYCNL